MILSTQYQWTKPKKEHKEIKVISLMQLYYYKKKKTQTNSVPFGDPENVEENPETERKRSSNYS